MSQENVELIRGLYDSFAKGDIPDVLNRMDPDIVWSEAENFIYADGNPFIGPQTILTKIFARLAGEWDNFAASPEEVLDAGDRIIVIGRLSGTYKITGKTVNAQMLHDWTLAGGKAVRFQEYTDTKQFAEAVIDDDEAE